MSIINEFLNIWKEDKYIPIEGKIYKSKTIKHIPLGWNNNNLPYIEHVYVYCEFTNGKRIPCTFKCCDGICEIHIKNKIFKYNINSLLFENQYKKNIDTAKIFIVKINNAIKLDKNNLAEGINYK